MFQARQTFAVSHGAILSAEMRSPREYIYPPLLASNLSFYLPPHHHHSLLNLSHLRLTTILIACVIYTKHPKSFRKYCRLSLASSTSSTMPPKAPGPEKLTSDEIDKYRQEKGFFVQHKISMSQSLRLKCLTPLIP